MKLENDQINFVTRAVAEWLHIKEENGQGTHSADADHSALLYRLLTGEKPLPMPPPVRFSQPDYQLGSGEPVELASLPQDANFVNDRVIIDQNSDWTWLDKEKRLLRHMSSGDVYQLSGEKTLTKIVEE